MGMTAADVVRAITAALNRAYSERESTRLDHSCATYVTTVLAPLCGEIPIDREELRRMGIQLVTVPSENTADGAVVFNSPALVETVKAVVQQFRARSLSRPVGGFVPQCGTNSGWD
jgi:hypothetical protein